MPNVKAQSSKENGNAQNGSCIVFGLFSKETFELHLTFGI
jgi:hypothetical protein